MYGRCLRCDKPSTIRVYYKGEDMTKKQYVKENFYDEYAIKKEDTIIAIVDSGTNARKICNELNALAEENKQLKQDNTSLMHLLENQSIIIQELHSKLLEHQVKEPIILTKEDLELMGKAISYYTHGRCVE